MFVPKIRLFYTSLLVSKFKAYRQTLYQKFLSTYQPLNFIKESIIVLLLLSDISVLVPPTTELTPCLPYK